MATIMRDCRIASTSMSVKIKSDHNGTESPDHLPSPRPPEWKKHLSLLLSSRLLLAWLILPRLRVRLYNFWGPTLR